MRDSLDGGREDSRMRVVGWTLTTASSISIPLTRAKASKKCSVPPEREPPYSFWHALTRWLLRSRSVPTWKVAAQLGHRAPGTSTTEIYVSFDPAYLTQAVRAIDEYFAILRDNCMPLQNLDEWFDKVTN
ncbi:MAG: hypothetical protein R3F37_09500 [Candidatus Competibacteraceae bacterium]